MPLLFNDFYGGGQEEVRLGSSRITPRETYSASPEGIRSQFSDNMRSVDSLVSALSGLSKAAGQYQAQQQEQADSLAWQTRDLINGVKTDDAVGAYSAAASGTISSGASPRMQARLQEYYGFEAARSYLATNKELQELLIDNNLRSQPAEFEKRIEGFVTQSITELRKQNPNLVFAGGAAQFVRNFANNAKSQSFEFANQEAQKTLRQAGLVADRDSMGQSAVFSRTEQVLREVNGDPTEALQVLAIENPQMNTRAISPERSSNAAAGLFQIKPNTFADIAKYPEARQYNLTDPMDERQNAIAYQLYWNRLKGQAGQILGREPKTAEVYMLYNLGPGAGGNALRAYASGNDAALSDFASPAAIAGNPKLYSRGMTVSGALSRIDGLMKGSSDFHTPITPIASRKRVELTQDNFQSRNYAWSDFKNSGSYGGKGQVDSRIVNILDDVTDQFGRKLKILSAHRDQQYDRGVGGAGNHPHGDALDIDLSGLSQEDKKKVVSLFVANGVRGIGTYASGNSIHVDLAVGREASGRQGAGVQTWNKSNHSWFNDGVTSGKEVAGTGYVRRPGFQNTPFNSTEARVRNLTQRYGYSPSEAREAVIQQTLQYSLNQAHAGMGSEAVLTSEALRANLKLTPAEELTVNNTLRSVEQVQRQLYEKKQLMEGQQAQDYLSKGIQEALQAEREGRTYQPNPDQMPQTAAGRKAYQDLMSIGLSPLPVSADVSKSNLTALTSRIDDPQLYDELGFTGGQRPRNMTETLAAIQKTKGRDLTPDDRIKLAESIELRRVGGPVAETFAKKAREENSAQIRAAFVTNTAALQKLQMDFQDPQTFQTQLNQHIQLMDNFYQQNYSVLYMSALQNSPNGAQLSAEERDVVARKALENTRAYGQYIGAIIAAQTPANRAQSAATMSMITSPETVVQQIIQQNNGRVDGQIAGIPRGSVIMVRPDGQPMRLGDGSYQVRLPDGNVIYYNPVFEARKASTDIRLSDDNAQVVGGSRGTPQQASAQTQSQAPERGSDTPEGQARLTQEAERRNALTSEARTFVSQAFTLLRNEGTQGAVKLLNDAIESNPQRADAIRRILRETITTSDPVLSQLRAQRADTERPTVPTLRQNAPQRGMTKEEKDELARIDKAIKDREKELMDSFKTILNR